MSRRAVLSSLLLAAALAAHARADDAIGVLAVADPPGPGAELAAFSERLRAALAARAPGVLAPEALRARMTEPTPPAALGELDRAYSGAIAANAAGEFDAANATLRGVVAALEGLPDDPAVFPAWTRAMVRLARSEQELGRAVEAQRVLERVLRAAPDLRPDPRQYPPSFHALVEEARARVRALGTRGLTVESRPEARVLVDGREVGTSPVTVDLAPGRHRVTGVRGGLASPALVVDLDEDRTVRLDMSLAGAVRTEPGPGLALPAPDRAAAALAAASRLALDHAVTVALLPDGGRVLLAAALLDVRRGAVEREGRIALSDGAAPPAALDALVAYLVSGRASALVSTPAGPSLSLAAVPPARPLAPEPAPPRSAGSAALGWSAVGVGAATLVAGTLAAVYARDAQAHYDDARAMLDPAGHVTPPNTAAGYNATIRSGDERRATATALGVATGVGVVGTAVLSWLSYRQSGEIGPFRF